MKNYVANEIESAEKSRAEAAELLEKQRALLKEARTESQVLIENAKKQADIQREEIVVAARTEAVRLKESAKVEIEQQKEKAVTAIREQVASLSVLIASKVIEKELNEKDQEKFINEYIHRDRGRAMKDSAVGNRYALALFQLAKEQNLLDQLEDELRVVREVVSQNTDLNLVLKSKKLLINEKRQLIKNAFSSVNPYVLNTLLILIDRHREDHIIQMADQFIQLANDERGIAEAKVISTRALTETEYEALSSTFAAKVGKKSLRIENIVDSNLLGGIKVQIGNRIYDGSLKGKLERLEHQLLS